jgi:hypothetical protein
VQELHASQAGVLSSVLLNALKCADEAIFADFLEEISQISTPDLFMFLAAFAQSVLLKTQ